MKNWTAACWSCMLTAVVTSCSPEETGSSPAIEHPRYFFSIEVEEQVNPLDFYPLEPGTTWVYENLYETSPSPDTLITVTWESRETVRSHYPYPEGLLIVREITNRHVVYEYSEDMDPQRIQQFLSRERIPEEELACYFVHGNRIYTVPLKEWDAEQGVLSQDYREKIQQNLREAAFFFPMEMVKVWGNPADEYRDYQQIQRDWQAGRGTSVNPGSWYWHVEEKTDVSVPYGSLEEVIPLTYYDNTGSGRIWFKYGIGIVEEKYGHNGTYIVHQKKLKEFIRP